MATAIDALPRTFAASRSRPLGLLACWLVTCAVGAVSWIICETVGGLIFLACGIRLWAYQITPILWAIASYTGWCYVFLILGTGCFAYLVWEHGLGVAGPRRWLYRSLFLIIAGPITEVIWNQATWNVLGTPLYFYTAAPTFNGSGSLFSPFYYQTLLLGFWMEEWVPGTLASLSREQHEPRP